MFWNVWSTAIEYVVAPLRVNVCGAPSATPSCPLTLLVYHETVREIGPVPSVVMLRVAVAVVGPVWLNPDTVTALTAGATGDGGAVVVVGVAVLPVPSGGVAVSVPPAEAEGSAPPGVSEPVGSSPGDDEGLSDAVDVGDAEADEVGAVVPAGSAPGPALVVARASAASCAAVPAFNGIPYVRSTPSTTAATETSTPGRPGTQDRAGTGPAPWGRTVRARSVVVRGVPRAEGSSRGSSATSAASRPRPRSSQSGP